MASDIKKDISQIRRCQKTVNVIGLILPPTSYDNLLDIMMVVVVFCKMCARYVVGISARRVDIFIELPLIIGTPE